MYVFADVVSSAPQLPFVMSPLVLLRRTLTNPALPLAAHLAHAVTAISAQHASVTLHLSSVSVSSPYPTYPITSEGLRYGTIAHALPPPATLPPTLLAGEMQCLADECRDLLQFLDLAHWQRWQHEHPTQRGQERVTARERDILLHYFAGYARSDIAVCLNITPLTVKTHLRNLYAKLGVHCMQEALSVGRAAGLVSHLL